MRTCLGLDRNIVLFVIGILAFLFIANGIGVADDNACLHCGMMKAKFGHSWVIIEHDDGTICNKQEC